MLVVDDEPGIRQAVASLPEDEGCKVRQVVNGMQALREGAGDHIDLVLSDGSVPRLDGAARTKRLRGSEWSVSGLLMSAAAAERDVPAQSLERMHPDIPRPPRQQTPRMAVREPSATE